MVTVAMAGVVMSPVDKMAVNISVSSGVVSSMIITFTVSFPCPGAKGFSLLGVTSKSEPAANFIINHHSIGGKKEYVPSANSDVRDIFIATKVLIFSALIISSTNSSTPSVTV